MTKRAFFRGLFSLRHWPFEFGGSFGKAIFRKTRNQRISSFVHFSIYIPVQLNRACPKEEPMADCKGRTDMRGTTRATMWSLLALIVFSSRPATGGPQGASGIQVDKSSIGGVVVNSNGA